MRTLLLALTLTTAPAFAQDVEPDSTSPPRFSLDARTGFAVTDGREPAGFVGVTGSYRVAPSTAVTFSATGGGPGPGRAAFASFGPGVAYSRPLDGQSELAASADVQLTGSQAPGGNLEYRGTRALGFVGADRAFKVVGSVEVVPTIGAYAAVGRWAEEVDVYGDSLGGAFASVGLLAGARVRFSAFGKTMEVPLVVPVEVFGRGQSQIPAYAEPYRTPFWSRPEVRQFVAENRPLLDPGALSARP